jgi:hypothetical protein
VALVLVLRRLAEAVAALAAVQVVAVALEQLVAEAQAEEVAAVLALALHFSRVALR